MTIQILLALSKSNSGLTITADIDNAATGASVVTGLVCNEVGITGNYAGSFTGYDDNADYIVKFYNGSLLVSIGILMVRDGQDVSVSGVNRLAEINTYPENSVGWIINRFNVEPTDTPLVVSPGPPIEPDKCRVTGWLHDATGAAMAGTKGIITLHKIQPSKSGNILVSDTPIEVAFGSDKYLTFKTNKYIDLIRNDSITPSGSYYTITIEAIGLNAKRFALTAEAFTLDLLVN